MLPSLGSLPVVALADRPDLVTPSVAAALAALPDGSVSVVEIDPALADTAALTEAFALPLDASVNCLVVGGSRQGDERIGACAVLAHTRADVNGAARRLLDVRKTSFLPMDRATALTGMEYGGITPVGLPPEWRVFVDDRIAEVPVVIIGSGLRRSKVLLSGAALASLASSEVVEGLGIPIPA